MNLFNLIEQLPDLCEKQVVVIMLITILMCIILYKYVITVSVVLACPVL